MTYPCDFVVKAEMDLRVETFARLGLVSSSDGLL